MKDNKDVSVLILSCDSYSDVWNPFFTLFNRYWECPYNVYIATETLDCKYAKALNHTGAWTKRIRDSLKEIDTKYVIIMCEDFFLREKVNQDAIDYTLKQFREDIAMFNFEKSYGEQESDIWGFNIKSPSSTYKHSCQASLWDRLKLIELLNPDMNPWEWEQSQDKSKYKFYINSSSFVFNYGYEDHKGFGIRKGKWLVSDVKPLFEKENIKVDFSIRGTYE